MTSRTVWMYALIGLLVFLGAMFLGIALNS